MIFLEVFNREIYVNLSQNYLKDIKLENVLMYLYKEAKILIHINLSLNSSFVSVSIALMEKYIESLRTIF